MSYEVTATRRRPQGFGDLVGQEFVVATLENAIKSGKIAHAYLFSGPRGCGKTSSARILAKVLNCEQGFEKAPCGECTACKEIAKSACMDVIEIDGASNTSVNDIRQIKDEVLFPPNSCKYKIYIIDEVHMLSTSAFNALLKTIEEPPPYVIFIFATTELHKVPATIKSRCQQFHFRLGSVEQIKNLLEQTAQELGIKADEEALYWIARESTGSFRDAYTLFDQVAAFSADYITYDKIRDKLGLVAVEDLNTLCEICVSAHTANAVEYIDQILQTGVSIEQFIATITDYLRNMLLLKSGITKESLLGNDPSRFSQTVLRAWSSTQLEHAVSLFLQLYRDVRYSLNPRYELELAISRLCWLSSYVSTKDVQEAIKRAQGQLLEPSSQQSSSVPSGMTTFSGLKKKTIKDSICERAHVKPSVESVSPIKKDSPVKEDCVIPVEKEVVHEVQESSMAFEDLQSALVDECGREKPLIAAAISQTQNWTNSDSLITIVVDTVFTKRMLDGEKTYLKEVVKKIWHKECEIEFILPKVEAKKAKEVPDSVKIVCDVFNAKVVGVDKNKCLKGDKNEY